MAVNPAPLSAPAATATGVVAVFATVAADPAVVSVAAAPDVPPVSVLGGVLADVVDSSAAC
jgi:hypothetical protein